MKTEWKVNTTAQSLFRLLIGQTFASRHFLYFKPLLSALFACVMSLRKTPSRQTWLCVVLDLTTIQRLKTRRPNGQKMFDVKQWNVWWGLKELRPEPYSVSELKTWIAVKHINLNQNNNLGLCWKKEKKRMNQKQIWYIMTCCYSLYYKTVYSTQCCLCSLREECERTCLWCFSGRY